MGIGLAVLVRMPDNQSKITVPIYGYVNTSESLEHVSDFFPRKKGVSLKLI